MGWFNKKKKDEKKEIPSLPELPKLPELPQDKKREPIHQLPKFPNDSFGKQISQDTIKEAITGKKEESAFGKKELEEPRFQGHSVEIKKEFPSPKIPQGFEEAAKKVKSAEPIFIRIDKFEEGLKVFEKMKNQINEIEKMLKDINQLKEQEEAELETWEKEIKIAKEQIQKIDNDIFSKVE